MTEVLDKETTKMTDRYITKYEYLILKKNWTKAILDGHEPKAWEFVLYNLLRDKPLANGFKKKTKNIQGNHQWYALLCALDKIKHQINPMRQNPLKEFYGVALPKDVITKIRDERDIRYAE